MKINNPWIKDAPLKQISLIFHSYLLVDDQIIEKLKKTIKTMNFSKKLKSFEIVVSRFIYSIFLTINNSILK